MSRAAERLGVSQPALTLAVKRLEDTFGQPVLLRGKTGVRLTKAGERLATQARMLAAEWERIKGDATRDEDELGGRYTVGCHPSVAMYSLPYFLPELLTEFPRLQINLQHDLSRKITEDVISFKVDFGIVVNPVPHPELVIKHLFDDEVTLWVGPGSSEIQNPKSENAVLIAEPELRQTQDILRQLARKKMYFKRTIHSSSLEVITALVAGGAGVGILPTRVATRFKAHGLRTVDRSIKFDDQIALIYRADAQKSEASRTLAKKIFEALA
jgi:DNA-binding transcriptional LysR family regulator